VKKRITIEIEYPEGYDAQWDVENGEHQVFHDEVVCGLQFALMEYTAEVAEIEKMDANLKALEKAPKGFLTDEQIKYCTQLRQDLVIKVEEAKHLRTKIQILRSIKVVKEK